VSDRTWQHAWLRIERGLIRSIVNTRWDKVTWPAAKTTLKRALEERRKIRRAGWFSCCADARAQRSSESNCMRERNKWY